MVYLALNAVFGGNSQKYSAQLIYPITLSECAWGCGNDATYTYVHTCCVGVLMILD